VNARIAARMLSLSPRTIFQLTKDGDLSHVRVGRRVLYPPDGLREWVAARTQGGRP
jgi:excisionase family DNA binding protein